MFKNPHKVKHLHLVKTTEIQANVKVLIFINMQIRTLTITKLGLYVSLLDIAKLLNEEEITVNKTQGDGSWLWDVKIKLAEEYLKQLKDGETDNYTELITLTFNDSFIHYSKLDEILPKSNHSIIPKINKQFGFMSNCQDEIFFEEKNYEIEEHILLFLNFEKNRLNEFEKNKLNKKSI